MPDNRAYMLPLADMYAYGRGADTNITASLELLQALLSGPAEEAWMDEASFAPVDLARPLAAQLDQTASAAEKEAAGWEPAKLILYNNGQPFNFTVTQQKANAGDVDAMFELALRYFDGSGLEADYKQSLNWLIKASEAGHLRLMTMLAAASLYGGSNVWDEQGLNWLTKAAQADYMPAQHFLIMVYEYGLGTKNDLGEVYYWTVRNHINPANSEADVNDFRMNDMKQKMSPEQLQQAKDRLQKEGYTIPAELN